MTRERGTWLVVVGAGVGVMALVAVATTMWSDRQRDGGAPAPPATATTAPDRTWTRFSDLVTVADDGSVVVASLAPGGGLSAKLAAALVSAGPELEDEPRELARAAMTAAVETDVTAAAGGDRGAGTSLARALVVQRRSGEEVVSADQILRLADALIAEGPPVPWTAAVAGTYWLRSELARTLLDRGDSARADQLALLDPGFVCALGSLAAGRPSDVALVVSYQRLRAPASCIDTATVRARAALRSAISATTVHLFDQLGTGDPETATALGAWLEAELAAGAARSPDGVVALTIAASYSDRIPPEALRRAAARTARLLASPPDSINGAPSFDAYLFAELDEAAGRRSWTPGISTDDQLAAFADDGAALFAAGTGTGDVERVRTRCGGPATGDAGVTGLPPFALLGPLAAAAATSSCDDVTADGTAAAVASSDLVAAELGGRIRTWAAAYLGCRYVAGPGDEAGLRDRIRSSPWDAPLGWRIEDNPSDYYGMFGDYALAWLDRFVNQRGSCAELTVWSHVDPP